jgi:hypothetical protein
MTCAQFGLIALIPAMVNLTVANTGGTISMQICTGDGQARTEQMPVGGSDEDGRQALCCAKGCHNGNSRKRGPTNIEPAQ